MPSSCPEAVVLAAFAEGSLPDAERREVERHVALCPECPQVVGATVRFLDAERDEDAGGSTRLDGRRLIAAAVVACCIAAVVWQSIASSDPLRPLRSIAATQSTRPFEGRLHRFPHARFDSRRAEDVRPADARLLREAQRLAGKGDEPEVLHARGVAALLNGRADEAVRFLTLATRATADDAAMWNDLAVAQLARASLGHTAAASAALVAADRAVASDPSSAAAHFNRALALEQLGRTGEAAAAFTRALEHERSSAWRDEIRQRLPRL